MLSTTTPDNCKKTLYDDLLSLLFFDVCDTIIGMAFRCGQNIHITKSEMENTNILPKGVNVSNCINTKSRILKRLSK